MIFLLACRKNNSGSVKISKKKRLTLHAAQPVQEDDEFALDAWQRQLYQTLGVDAVEGGADAVVLVLGNGLVGIHFIGFRRYLLGRQQQTRRRDATVRVTCTDDVRQTQQDDADPTRHCAPD